MDRLMTSMDHFDNLTKNPALCKVVIFLLLLTQTSAFSNSVSDISAAVTYFEQYGYLKSHRSNEKISDSAELAASFAKLQRFCGIKETGVMDEETRACMRRRRCGNVDVVPRSRRAKGGRQRRFYIPVEGETWFPPSVHFTYDIVTYTEDLPPTVVDDSIARAFQLWSNATVLSFERIRGGDVDISIYFYPSFEDHGDNMTFDGPGQVLAHAFWPWSEDHTSDVHFDEAETWTARSYSGANLWLVAAHEIGHSLGLGHSIVFSSLMFPFHFGYNPDFVLHEDDINGVRALYGDTVPTPAEPPLDAPDICNEVIDAVMVDGFTYIFKGDYYWRILNGRPERGYPRRVTERWPGLEGDIDAAITVKNDYVWSPYTGRTYFFKGRRVWRYTLNRLDSTFPKDVAEEFPGFPSDVQQIKGIFEISGNGETYVFTDNGFYLYSWLGFQGPYGLQAFGGVPSNIVAVMQWTDNYVYFFTDDFMYYQCSPWSFSISRGYPQLAHIDWIGCSQ